MPSSQHHHLVARLNRALEDRGYSTWVAGGPLPVKLGPACFLANSHSLCYLSRRLLISLPTTNRTCAAGGDTSETNGLEIDAVDHAAVVVVAIGRETNRCGCTTEISPCRPLLSHYCPQHLAAETCLGLSSQLRDESDFRRAIASQWERYCSSITRDRFDPRGLAEEVCPRPA